MRVWEVEDNKAVPSDLVREQDFILTLRRLQRHGSTCLVLNFIINGIPALAKDVAAREARQEKLREIAKVSGGVYFEMTRGDVFMVLEGSFEAEKMAARVVEVAFPEMGNGWAQFVLSYQLPQDYAKLRERANHYIETVRAAATVEVMETAGRVEEARGALDAKTVDQIGHLLGEINVRRYGRTQRIYRRTADKWQTLGEEYFISFEDLRREHFPRLQVISSEHFFLALCGMLDQKLLGMLTNSYEMIANRMINLNLSVASIMGAPFSQFVRRVPRGDRHLLGFELNRGDLFQDFSLTLSAMETLRNEGFRIALDGITPDMVNYMNLAAFPVDAIKMNVSKDRAAQLDNPAIRKGLEALPPEKLIFFRCDNERALAIGSDLGVRVFQGWLIDDIAGKKNA
jgi:EAL domain-containing protein (putative c-di-GMP-specific phosphodiesterase class I)